MKRALKHGMTDIDRVRTALDAAYKANAARLLPYAPKMVWNGAREATVAVTVMSKSIVANFTITDEDVIVESKIPFVFSYFEEKIMKILSEALETSFAKVRATVA